MAELAGQVAQHAQIIDRVDVAGDDVGEGTYPRSVGCLLRQKRRLRAYLVEIFEDRHRLDQDPSAILERRNQTLRVDAAIIGFALIVAAQVDRRGVVGEPLQIEADADSEGGGGPEITVEPHQRDPFSPD